MDFILTKNGRKFCPTIGSSSLKLIRQLYFHFVFLTYLIFIIIRVLNKFSLMLRALYHRRIILIPKINSWYVTALVSLRTYSVENTGHRHAELLAYQHMTSTEK